MKECGTLLEDFYRAVSAGLHSKAGCILFQFPPKFVYNEERMLLLSEGLKKDFRNVVEFRDASWFKPEVLKRLKSCGIIVSGLSHPTLLLNQDIIQSNDIIYYRFMVFQHCFIPNIRNRR